jgi:putative sterol carrier protein
VGDQGIIGQTKAGMTEHPTVRYLSLAWLRELSREVAESETLQELARDHRIGVTQVVTDGPEGDVTYHLQVGDGELGFGAGPASSEDLRMEQDWATAVAVATGELNAQEAFVTGRIRISGDPQALMDAQPVFGALDSVFTTVRGRTRYE